MLRALAHPQLRCRGARSYQRHAIPSWATVDPWEMSAEKPGTAMNLLQGEWVSTASTAPVVDPMNGEAFLMRPDLKPDELGPYIASMKSVPKSGFHNPLKDPNAYFRLGEVNALAAMELRKPEVANFLAQLSQRIVPKHDAQSMGEITCVRKWLDGYAGDGVRRLAQSQALPGDHVGQETRSYRYPYGATSVITPFNFPLEIPALQSLSSVWMGNKCVVKVDEKVQIVYEQFLRMLIHCGLDANLIDMVYCDGPTFNQLLVEGDSRMTLFTGSQAIAEKLTVDLRGKVKLEDAGFDWKILGPDVVDEDYVAWQSDQDAYAFSGQKCSAQSIMFMHENWVAAGIVDKLAAQAAKRNVEDLSSGPVMSWTTEQMLAHVQAVSSLPGASVTFGGEPLGAGQFPPQYGGMTPTAVTVPLETMLASQENFDIVTTELFGPFQVLVPYNADQLPLVLDACERMTSHLTAAVVSNDVRFCNEVLGATINGTMYSGIRARTTGAPQQHWFGPCGDPRSAGIHTPEAIRLCWSSHREIIHDVGPVDPDWTMPTPT